MIKLIEKTISAHTMLDGVKEITVALSGGADSVALFHAMHCLREKYGFSLYAAHLNHSLRGDESEADAEFVRELCKACGVPLFLDKADVSAFAAEQKQSVELAARNIRYAFLQRVAKGKIATAHTANDNAETVLFNLSRGAALSGVCGIPPVRDNIIRPLIYCTRDQIEQYCEANGLSYRNDSSNADQQYARNRIRHSVLPQLQQINNGCVSNISRMTENLRQDADYIDTVAKEQYKKLCTSCGLPVSELLKLHGAILSRVLLLHSKSKTGLSPDNYHLDCMKKLLKNGTRTQISGDIYATNSGGYFDLGTITVQPELYAELGDNFKNLSFPGIKFTYTSGYSKKINKFVFKNSFDCAKIKGKLIIRNRLSGDTFYPIGRNGTKTLKKLFNENHLPLSVRGTVKILADDQGIVWIEGFGVDERVKVTEKTEQFVTVDNRRV